MLMTIEQKSSLGSESSITSIGSRINLECILNENCETTGVPLKVRKPYTISKQREKWTQEEHKRFIEALRLYGRAWRQIEEYIGTKSAVQIRSHAQKFFSKVMKEGACSVKASTEPVAIPPPRPKRKPLHPYPRKLVETPNKTSQFPTLLENGASTNMKTSDREVHYPITVLSPEGSQISASHVMGQGNSYVSRTSSGSNLSHDVERETLIKDDSTQGREKRDEENLSLTLYFSGPSPNDSTLMGQSAGKIMKDIESTKDEDNCSDKRIKCVGLGGGSPIKSVKLFGRTMAVPDQSEYSDGMNDVVIHTATSNHFTELASKIDGYFSVGKRHSEKASSKGFSCTGSNSNSFNEVKNAEANFDSVDSKLEYKQQVNANANNRNKGFYPYKRCFSDREAVHTPDDRESQRIRVSL